MVDFSTIASLIPSLEGRVQGDVCAENVQAAVARMDDADVVAVLAAAAEAGRHLEQVRLAAAGVIAPRSPRESGHSGLAQRRGHRSPVGLVQELTGATKGEAARQVRVGAELLAP